MTRETSLLSTQLQHYLLDVGIREPSILKNLRLETESDEMSRMQISPEQGQFMSMLTNLIQPGRILEIGTYTGYSSLCMALNTSKDSVLYTCDQEPKWTDVAQRYWREAGVDHKIKLMLGDAKETMRRLITEFGEASFDMIFIDADKENYPEYLSLAKRLLRIRGVMLIDNVFWKGNVLDSGDNTEATLGVRELNQTLHNDADFQISMLPISDGLTLALKLN